MTRRSRPSLPARRPGLLVIAVALLAACSDGPPPSPAGAASPALPADHPPVGSSSAASPPRLPAATVLASVGDQVITAGDVATAIAAMPSPDRLEFRSPDPVRELVEALVDQKLMAAAARTAGMGGGDEQALAAAWQDAQLGPATAVSDQDVATYYREHRAEFTEPARVLVTRVVAPDETVAARLRGELARGATTMQLRERGAGQLWLQDAGRLPEPTRVALDLKVGEVSRPVETARGFVVMRADEHAPARLRPLDEVRAGIVAGLEDVRRQAAARRLRERLRRDARITFNDALIAAYATPLAEAG